MKIQIPKSVDCALSELSHMISHTRLSNIHEYISLDVRDCKVRIHPFKEYEGIGEGCLLFICTDYSFHKKEFNWFTFLITTGDTLYGDNKHFHIIIKQEIEPLYDEEVELI